MALPETVDCSVSVSGTCSPTVRAAPVVGDNTLALFRRDLTAYRGAEPEMATEWPGSMGAHDRLRA